MEGAKVLRLRACICLNSLPSRVQAKKKLIVCSSLLQDWQTLIIKGDGLQALTVQTLGSGLQISDNNQIVGLEPRANLLQTLGTSLKALPEIFGDEGRPGNLVGELSNCYLCVLL